MTRLLLCSVLLCNACVFESGGIEPVFDGGSLTDAPTADGQPDQQVFDAFADAPIAADSGPPDAAADAILADTVAPDTVTPDTAIPDTLIPDIPVDLAIPDTLAPDQTVDTTDDAGPIVVFSDNFSGGAGNWSSAGGNWSVVTDVTDSSNLVFRQDSCANNTEAIVNAGPFQDVTISARVRIADFCGGNNPDQQAGVFVRAASTSGCSNNYYACLLDADGDQLKLKIFNGSCTVSSSDTDNGTVDYTDWYTIRLSVTGHSVTCVAGRNQQTPMMVQTVVNTGAQVNSGDVGLLTAAGTAEFDDVVVTTP